MFFNSNELSATLPFGRRGKDLCHFSTGEMGRSFRTLRGKCAQACLPTGDEYACGHRQSGLGSPDWSLVSPWP